MFILSPVELNLNYDANLWEIRKEGKASIILNLKKNFGWEESQKPAFDVAHSYISTLVPPSICACQGDISSGLACGRVTAIVGLLDGKIFMFLHRIPWRADRVLQRGVTVSRTQRNSGARRSSGHPGRCSNVCKMPDVCPGWSGKSNMLIVFLKKSLLLFAALFLSNKTRWRCVKQSKQKSFYLR